MKKLTLSIVIVLMFTMMAVGYAQNQLIDQKCAICHTTERVYSKKADKVTWDAIVERMKRHGLKITADEEKQIKEYLYTLK